MQKSSFYAETRVEEEEERDGGGPTIGLADSGKIHRCLLDVSVSGQFFNSFIAQYFSLPFPKPARNDFTLLFTAEAKILSVK